MSEHDASVLPPYIEAVPLAGGPPFEFDDVTARVFPLPARMETLQRLCRTQLRLTEGTPDPPPTVQPFVPCVLLIALHYGRMRSEDPAYGWISQHEVLFGIPVEWRAPDGKLIDTALFTPFIFVDDADSVRAGREVYGWPKYDGWVRHELPSWMTSDLRYPQRIMALDTWAFEELYAGRKLEPTKLLSIERHPTFKFGKLPPDLFSERNPLLSAPLAAMHGLPQAFAMARALPGMGRAIALFMTRLVERWRQGDFPMTLNNINLKQFPSAEEGKACYQALVNAPMQLRRLNALGLLGEENYLLGDNSGGFRIHLYERPGFPIVETLGLEGKRLPSSQVFEVRPFLPTWLNVDLRLERGSRLVWRMEEPGKEYFPFHAALGPVIQPPQGPFEFRNVLLRVFPLRCRKESPEGPREPGDYQDDENYRMSPIWEDHTFLIVMTFEDINTERGSTVGRWIRYRVGFATPTTMSKLRADEDGPAGAWHTLLWDVSFVDSPVAVSADREGRGFHTFQAEINGGDDPWLDDEAPERELLSLELSVFPEMGTGQRKELRKLIEIEHSGDFSRNQWHEVPNCELSFSSLNLKQFRDSNQLDRAAYQAWMHASTTVTRLPRPGEDSVMRVAWLDGEPEAKSAGQAYTVKIHRYPEHPLVEGLDLEVAASEIEDGVVVETVATEAPFAARIDMIDSQDEVAFWHDGEKMRKNKDVKNLQEGKLLAELIENVLRKRAEGTDDEGTDDKGTASATES